MDTRQLTFALNCISLLPFYNPNRKIWRLVNIPMILSVLLQYKTISLPFYTTIPIILAKSAILFSVFL